MAHDALYSRRFKHIHFLIYSMKSIWFYNLVLIPVEFVNAYYTERFFLNIEHYHYLQKY